MASQFYLRTPSSSKTASVATVSISSPPPLAQETQNSPQKRPGSQQRTSHSSAPAMRLPSGYTTDHWAWSMSDPSFRAGELTTLPWEEFDDTFLFPMMSLKESSVLTAEPEDEFEDQLSSSDDTASLNSSSTAKSKPAARPAARPPVPRAQSHTQAKAPKAHDDARRANSITIPMIKSVRRARKQQQMQRAQDAYKQRKVSELLTLRRQVADLTQRLTLIMANQCAACQLGLVDCGLARRAQAETAPKSDESGMSGGPRDREREGEIEGKIQRLARQAELLAF